MTITIIIETDNAAFNQSFSTSRWLKNNDDNGNPEVARILKQLASRIQQNDCGGLRDINGNVVGNWIWE